MSDPVSAAAMFVPQAPSGDETRRRLAGKSPLEVAKEFDLHKVATECADNQPTLVALLQELGFYKAARLGGFIRDRRGRSHDMVLMVRDLR